MNKKMFLGAGCAIAIAISAFGSTSFSWSSLSPATYAGTTDSFPLGYTVLTYTSADTNINYDALSPFQTTYGNDNFFTATSNIFTSTFYITGYMENSDDSLVGRYAYAVLLDIPFSSYSGLASIPVGTKWGVSAISQVIVKQDGDPPGSPQDFNGGPVEIIPEPAVTGLALVGLVTAAVRRRRMRA